MMVRYEVDVSEKGGAMKSPDEQEIMVCILCGSTNTEFAEIWDKERVGYRVECQTCQAIYTRYVDGKSPRIHVSSASMIPLAVDEFMEEIW
jgi:hypothetical protein